MPKPLVGGSDLHPSGACGQRMSSRRRAVPAGGGLRRDLLRLELVWADGGYALAHRRHLAQAAQGLITPVIMINELSARKCRGGVDPMSVHFHESVRNLWSAIR